jgi:hypothetical protein
MTAAAPGLIAMNSGAARRQCSEREPLPAHVTNVIDTYRLGESDVDIGAKYG